ncbi:TIGR04283 family arsenosugar biosynthesis glycosyltransferase [Desulfonatronum lacustre]|uniref:TIGR04283 family arsenosugar biosynthesis glycosyltransferase n=1 Tax=Desulfonatronum lacustre TaxID=66849 RepID=UPI0004BAC7C3|nr:TIGR04283 family arsenosugar biosynthesis glycosyltransferase [Desulfonatronum lacustre]SMP41821.1 transferase 2, rSAM/selenodomain-associated [Desulfonatronum zhilinae]
MNVRLSVIIPAFREERGITSLVDHLTSRALRETAEILVVDGDSEQRTLVALQGRDVIRIGSDAGRARQMNAGAAQARGDVLLFLHADTRLPPGADTLIFQALRNLRLVGGAFRLAIDSPRPALGLIAAAANLRTRLTRVPYGDQAIFLRRAAFEELGGYADIPLMEDLELMRRVRRKRWPVVLLREAALTSARRWEQEGVWNCTLRNWGVRLLYHFGASPARLRRFYPTAESLDSGARPFPPS